jgi:hypothetical protein
VRDEYVGRIIDESCNIVDGHDGSTVIGNKQLRFIAYSVFTSMKHGYLGKRNRVQLPICVEHGIHDTFPDSNILTLDLKVQRLFNYLVTLS